MRVVRNTVKEPCGARHQLVFFFAAIEFLPMLQFIPLFVGDNALLKVRLAALVILEHLLRLLYLRGSDRLLNAVDIADRYTVHILCGHTARGHGCSCR